jgi:hypothetical protein
MNIWRLGHSRNPCAFVPRTFCKWHHRFDDPQKVYRTLYGAQHPLTCLRELLADLRPNTKALTEFETLFSDGDPNTMTIAGVVSSQWRKSHALVWAEVEFQKGKFAAIEEHSVLHHLKQLHHALLTELGIKNLNLQKIRSRQRPLTQAFSRTLFNDGHAGIIFRSRLDEKICYALFEGRARLTPAAKPIPMTMNHPDLLRVCGEYTLVLRT